MKADPPVRADGRCARPGCGKPRKMPKAQKGIDPLAYERDPFCSTECCRRYHGAALPERDATKQGRPRVYARAA